MNDDSIGPAEELYPECPRLNRCCPLRINGWRCRNFEDAVICDEENGGGYEDFG